MSASEILKEIKQLSAAEKLFVIEKALKDFLQLNYYQQLSIAAEAMENDYKTDPELTAFSNLDWEDFYEPK